MRGKHSVARALDKIPKRELELVRMVAGGLRNNEIARRLSITEATVKTHLHSAALLASPPLPIGEPLQLGAALRQVMTILVRHSWQCAFLALPERARIRATIRGRSRRPPE